MYCAKIIIPKISDTYKLYVYSSKNPESINTIAKVKTIQPTFVIDESTAETQEVNGQECYVLYHNASAETQEGVVYLGPAPNLIPITEYETEVTVVTINHYTYANQLVLNPLPIKYNGTMLYYSVIGVDEANQLITHLSKVNGVMIDSDYQQDGTRHLYSCEDYTGKESDVWKYITAVPWETEIKIGDVNDPSTFAHFGIPVVETVNKIDASKITCTTKTVGPNNYMTLEIPNPWQRNNKEYNYRKLKSYKLQNVSNEQYSDFSEPTYQSLLPVSIEKMLILKEIDPAIPEAIIPIDSTGDNIRIHQIIRKDGIYYNAKDHRKLGLNKFTIALDEPVGIFSEASVQEQIKIQTEALPNHVYSYTIYLFDVYGNISKPAHFTITT